MQKRKTPVLSLQIKTRFIPWAPLQEQMGSEISEVKNYGRRARKAIAVIQKYYKELKISFPTGGLNPRCKNTPTPRCKCRHFL